MSSPAPLHERINIRGTIDAWARYTVADWRKAILKQKIGDSGDLNRSFGYQLHIKGIELIRIQFRFHYTGKFVDMGVGKGVKIGDVGELKISRRLQGKSNGNRRRRKPWLNKPFEYNKSRLAEIIARLYSRNIGEFIVETIEQ